MAAKPYGEFIVISPPPKTAEAAPPAPTQVGQGQSPYEDFTVISTPQEIPVGRPPSFLERMASAGPGVGIADVKPTSLMTEQELKESLRQQLIGAAATAAGPATGAVLTRFSAPAVEMLPGLRVASPFIEQFGRAVQSGGFGAQLPFFQRVAGGATSGAVSGAVSSPEDAAQGAKIGAVLPVVGKTVGAMLKPIAKTTEETLAQASALYKQVDDYLGRVAPEKFSSFVDDLRNIATEGQFLSKQHKRVNDALELLEEQRKVGQPLTVERLEKLRSRLASARFSKDKEESEMAKKMTASFEQFLDDNAPDITPVLRQAREFFTLGSKGKIIDNIIEKAKDSTVRQPSKYIRNEFTKLVDGVGKYKNKLLQFSKEQQQLIRDIASGQKDITSLEKISNVLTPEITSLRALIPSLAPSSALYGALYRYMGPEAAGLAAIAGTGTGAAARKAANELALARAGQVSAFARTGVRPAERFTTPTFAQPSISTINALSPSQTDFMAEQQRVNQLGF